MIPAWPELRASALVGTEKRAPKLDQLAGVDPTTLADPGPEQLALHAAALLGAQREAGARPARLRVDAPGPPEPEAPEPYAPDRAVQLLELLLAGNLGRPQSVPALAGHWFAECRRAGRVVPHRLLARVLDLTSSLPDLHADVRPCLGRRGVWLASRRDPWRWATVEPAGDTTTIDAADLIALDKADRVAALRAVRADDADRGRALLETLLPDLDAATRADLTACLAVGLGPDDEPLLEAALDDRSKNVRRVAIGLLDGLPGSARARRLAEQLAPLVSIEGRLRPVLTVAVPGQPEADAARDMPPPDGSIVVEAHWLRTLVAGAPLAWWETTLGEGPDKLVGRRMDPAEDLLAGWTRAAIAEQNQPWAAALLTRTTDPELWAVAGDAPPDLVAEHLERADNGYERARILHALPRPWSPALATAVLRAARATKGQAGLVEAMTQLAPHALPAESLPAVQQWLDATSTDDQVTLHRELRRLVQSLTVRQSITEAFP